jgi:hypothetical protein
MVRPDGLFVEAVWSDVARRWATAGFFPSATRTPRGVRRVLQDMRDAFAKHWPEYLMEAAGLGLFMISAGSFAILLFHPASAVAQAIPSSLAGRLLMGCAMGLTAIGLIYSPWGKQSGAHFNPAVTLSFLRLGKIAAPDALFYVVAHFVGGVAGILLVALASRGSSRIPRSTTSPRSRASPVRPRRSSASWRSP